MRCQRGSPLRIDIVADHHETGAEQASRQRATDKSEAD
jgi:hypothetical protein